MKTVEITPIIMFRANEKEFLEIIKPLTDQDRNKIKDCPTFRGLTIVERRCHGTKEAIEAIIPGPLLASLHSQIGLRVTVEEADFLALIRPNMDRYAAAFEKGEISNTGVLQGQSPHQYLAGREIVGTEQIIRSVFPQLQLTPRA